MEQESCRSLGDRENRHKSTWARIITPNGEIEARTNAMGKTVYYPLNVEELKGLPKSFKEAHAKEMALFHNILLHNQKNYPKRNLPVTRTEYFGNGASPRAARDLEDFGLLKSALIPCENSRQKGKNIGSRLCYYYTDQGRAYIRAGIDPTYALNNLTGT
jgi:hypothetical protein